MMKSFAAADYALLDGKFERRNVKRSFSEVVPLIGRKGEMDRSEVF